MIGAGNVDVNFSTLEGFIAAKVLIEGLRRRGRDPMREGFVAALESMANCHMESADRVYHPHPL